MVAAADGRDATPKLFGRIVAVLRGPAPVYLTASVLARLGSTLLIPLYTRRLSPGEYGDFALAQSILGFLPLLFTLGLISAVPKFYFSEPDRASARASAGSVALWLATTTAVFTAATCIGVLLLVPGRSGSVMHRYELTCVCIAAAGSALSSVPDTVFRSEQRPYQAAAYQLTQFGLQLGLGFVFVLWLRRGLRGAIEAMTLGYAVTGLVALVFIIGSLKGRLDKSILWKALPFALPFLPHFVANWVQISADRWTMKAFHFEDQLGAYVLALQLTSPITMVVVALNDVETARLGETSRAGGVAAMAKVVGKLRLRYVLVACLPSVAIVACLPVLPYVIGSRFIHALRLAPLLAVVFVVDSLYYPSSNVLYYASRTRAIAATTAFAAALNVVLNLAFVPFWGAIGAIVARFVTAAARAAVIWRVADRVLHVEGASERAQPAEPPES
jgi:O-antigen/teichoic acid export membrane protein